MSRFRAVFLVFLTMVMCVVIFGSAYIIQFAIAELNFGWMTSFLLPKALLLLAALAFLISCLKSLKKAGSLKWLVGFCILGLPIGTYLMVNIPYVDDWVKHGKELRAENQNPIEAYLKNTQPEFDGLICFFLPGCPHCENAISKLELLHQRQPDLDLVIFVFSEDSAIVNAYTEPPNASDLTYVSVPDPNESFKLNQGIFPSFFYCRDGSLIYRWTNSEFGYPALDWIENRLQ